MRFSLSTAFLLISKSLACVDFLAVMQFPEDDLAYVSAILTDNNVVTCQINPAVALNQQEQDFVWLDCIDGYYATFSWINPNPVSYATPGFEGTFETTAVQDTGIGITEPTWGYDANVYGY
jgi:hypothetical protein